MTILRNMIPWFLTIGFCLIAMYQTGCAIDRWSAKPNCVPRALYSAYVANESGYEVRILDGPTAKKGVHHWQAQAFIDGEWRALTNDWAKVYVSKPDNWYSPDKIWTLKEAWEHQLRFIK
uniref:Transglutaminase domain-containing protein n=1 Tax=viral metagenome TaxID=1070528 RepID=A0A6H2A673_9ZZZZ